MIWNILESRELRRLQGHRNWVNHLAVSEGGRLVATAGEDASILLWDFATGKSLSRPLTGHTSSVNAVAFDSEGKLLASGDSSGNLLIWTLGDAVRRIAAVRVPGPILQLTFAPDGLHLAVLRQPGVLDLVPVDVPFMQAEARRIRECGRGR